jgi:predicted amidohydrolase
MRIALAAANMGKPITNCAGLLARLERLAFDSRDCSVLVLPEYWAMQVLDYAPNDLKPTDEIGWMAHEIKEMNFAEKVCGLVRRYEIAILPGSWPVLTKDGYVNRAHFIDEDGVLAVQDKMSLTDEETDRMGWYLKPGEKLDVFKFMGVTCAIAICHDTAKAEEFKELKADGVELVFMPSMCTFEGNEKTVDGHKWIFNHAKLRSKEMGCYFACVGSVGMQTVGYRVEENVGGAALYKDGVCLSEIGPLKKGRGASAFILKVDVDV